MFIRYGGSELNKKAILLVLYILIFSFVITGIYSCKGNKDEDSTVQLTTKYNPNLYNLELSDWKGRLVRFDDIKDKALYIQFLDNKSIYDNEFLMNVFIDWGDYKLVIIVFTTKPDQLVASHPEIEDKVIIINNNLDKVRHILDSNKNNSFCYLFGLNREYIIRAETIRLYESGMKYEFIKTLRGNIFQPKDLLGGGNNIFKSKVFNKILLPYTIQNKYVVINLMSKYCEGCVEGRILSVIKQLYKEKAAEAMVIFYNGINENDIINFKSQIDIDFPVHIASGDLLKKWDSIFHEYSVDAVSSIVLVAEGNGEICDYYFNGCECEDAFINRLRELIKKVEGK